MDKKVIYAVLAVIIVAVASAGITYAVCDKDSGDSAETYDFYMYFGADNKDNGWIEGTGNNAAEGFSNAMEKAGFTYTLSTGGSFGGYLSTINDISGYWMTYQYLYNDTNAAAATASINSYTYKTDGYFTYSDGWAGIAGYNADGVDFKLSEINGNVFLISYYDKDVAGDPIALYSSWSSSGIFAD